MIESNKNNENLLRDSTGCIPDWRILDNHNCTRGCKLFDDIRRVGIFQNDETREQKG